MYKYMFIFLEIKKHELQYFERKEMSGCEGKYK